VGDLGELANLEDLCCWFRAEDRLGLSAAHRINGNVLITEGGLLNGANWRLGLVSEGPLGSSDRRLNLSYAALSNCCVLNQIL
jgi:hypothetical protein